MFETKELSRREGFMFENLKGSANWPKVITAIVGAIVLLLIAAMFGTDL